VLAVWRTCSLSTGIAGLWFARLCMTIALCYRRSGLSGQGVHVYLVCHRQACSATILLAFRDALWRLPALQSNVCTVCLVCFCVCQAQLQRLLQSKFLQRFLGQRERKGLSTPPATCPTLRGGHVAGCSEEMCLDRCHILVKPPPTPWQLHPCDPSL
jgi:hypothetical protein